ncbi:sporozoite surface protein 3, putative [Plasmodium ovale wallikeri]|uniref:Sporozoite surface protein 3, putative n=1 Tax=Plasmodium ovale wallikeri TaxID=864142 RepID=A0A1A8ZXM7_PLAOA|nr:sporozoite surface protein 3, putative [Plasmodium ovale wallikeri]
MQYLKSTGYVCDFSAEKYSLDFDDYYDDSICYQEVGIGDSIGIIIPKYRDGNEKIEILTKCFDEISLNKSGDNPISIYDIFRKDEIIVSDSKSMLYNNTEYISSILKIKNTTSSNYIHCVFENKNKKGMIIHKGIGKILIKNSILKNNNVTHKLVIDLFNEIDLNKDNSNNKYSIYSEPGHILYLLGMKLSNGTYIYFDKNCPLNFEKIGEIYKYIFPIINEKEITYTCKMYFDENEKTTSIGSLIITFFQKDPNLKNIDKEILKKYIKYDIENNLYKLLYGTKQEDYYVNSNNGRYKEQSVDINESTTSNLQSINIHKEYCNNNNCIELFNKSRCSSICGNGFRLLDGYNIRYDIQSVIPCNNGECTPEDAAEPFSCDGSSREETAHSQNTFSPSVHYLHFPSPLPPPHLCTFVHPYFCKF